MRSRELQKYLSTVSTRSLSDIDQRCRGLRRSKEIPSGPRGRSAPHLTRAEAAIHILCLVSDKASDAVEVSKALTFCELAKFQPFEKTTDFADAVGAGDNPIELVLCMVLAMADPDLDFTSIEFAADGSHAWANIRIDGSLRRLLFVYGNAEFTEADFFAAENRSASNVFVIGGDILREIGRSVAEASSEEEE